MGQYWLPVNLTKKEFIDPHKLGCGLKLWEQVANSPSTGTALLILTAAMPMQRGGGDLEEDPIVGSWAGDKIAVVGDYAEDGDLPNGSCDVPASKIYELCRDASETPFQDGKTELPLFRDVTDAVCRVIERELNGTFEGAGWRTFKRKGRENG